MEGRNKLICSTIPNHKPRQAMRIRLRAPDEPEAENSYESSGNTSASSTYDQSHFLPPLDVGSPEYIEERLENLKRRPAWRDFLDQYVQDHPESGSDSEEDDSGTLSTGCTPGLIRSTLWSLLVVVAAPLLILCVPCLRHKDYGFWPLGCHSMKELFGRAVTNVIFIVFGLLLLYWTICRELPDFLCVDNTLVKLNVQIYEMIHAVDTCHAALLQWEWAVGQELCMPVGIDVVLLLVNTCLLLHCHRRRARCFMVLMAVIFIADVPTKLYDATFPAPEIHMVNPNFALVDEELLVSLEGKNLKHGGSVAWVAYWGCAITANVDACDKQFVSTFEVGNVAVTFKSLDHFVPCYRDPPNPLKAQNYQCFEHVRIRVKEKQSIPGWSRLATQASSKSVQVLPSLSSDWLDRLEIPSFKGEEESLPTRINQNTIKSTNSKRKLTIFTESIEAVEVDISPSSSERLMRKNDGPPVLGKEPARLPGKGGDGEKKSTRWGSQENKLERGMSEAAELAKEELAEVEVTPDAEVRMFHVNTEPNFVQSDQRDDTTSLAESSQYSSYFEKVELDEPRNEAVKSAYERECALKKELDVLGDEEMRAVDETSMMGATNEALGSEENMQAVSPDIPRERERYTEVERDAGTRTHEASSDEASSSVTTAQKAQKKLDSKYETSNPSTVQVMTTSSRPLDIANNRMQLEGSIKKRKGSKRKGPREKESGPAILDNVDNAE